MGYPARQVQQPGDEDEVVRAGQGLVDRGVLPGEPDPGAHRGRIGDDVVTQHPGRPSSGRSRVASTRTRRRLARAVRLEQPEHCAAADREVHAVERPRAPEALAQALDLDDGVHAMQHARGH
jgi:hypothetical protein